MLDRRKVLVIGDDTRSFLAIVRSLGRQGLAVHVAPFDFAAPALKSRYIAQVHWLPYYLADGAEWLGTMTQLLQTERFHLVIPCDERSLLPLERHREQLELLSRLAIPDRQAVRTFYDKHATRELAGRLDIPIAAGRLLQAEDKADDLVGEIGSPLVIKPRQSYKMPDLYSRRRVCLAHNRQDLDRILPVPDPEAYLVEAFFPGEGFGISVLANRGLIVQAFQHHRVREDSGGSYYRVSAALSQAPLAACGLMVAALGYTGLAMFEFRQNRENGRWILLEVNARPWGSMPLPVAIGVDFPYGLFRLLVDGVEPAAKDYPVGVYGRNFLPDLYQLVDCARAIRKDPIRLLNLVGGAFKDYCRVFAGREVHDVLIRDDPLPGLFELAWVLAGPFKHFASAMPGRAARDRSKTHAAVRRSRGGTTCVVFVCQGNICRSPFAAQLLNRLAGEMSHAVDVASAGMLPRPGNASPAAAIAAAHAWSLNLSAHSSRHLTRSLANSATVLVIFDEKNEDWLRRRYPGLGAPTVKLSSFAQSSADIADPDGGDLAQFRRTYEQIDNATRGLAAVLRAALA